METCPNCRYELRTGQTTCPFCGTAIDKPVRRVSPRALAVGMVVVLGLVGLAVGASLAGRGRPAATRQEAAECRPVQSEDTVPKQTYTEPPTEELDPNQRYTLVLETSCGEIDVALDVRRAPKTTSSVAFLAREGFFDGLAFHRVEPQFVIQGGDPEGNGTGGPGFTVVEAPPQDLRYEEGVVAMAKRADEPPGASGSQFFIVSGPRAASLPPQYALVGRVVEGMDVVAAIERVGSEVQGQNAPGPGGRPEGAERVVIERATVRSS